MTLPPPGRTAVPEGITDPMAAACLMRRGLEIVEASGLWDTLPGAARELFLDALYPPLGSAAKQVADLANERDHERALANKLLAALAERDATIKALRAELLAARQGGPR